MARFGTWNPLAGNWASQSRMTQVDILSIHTMVGSLAGTDSMWRRTGYSGNHSHFGIGGNGECTQWQDTAYRAAANYNGNWHIISVECADVGAPFPAWNTNDGAAVPAFSAPQIETLAQLIAAMCKAHNIPCVLIPDSKVGRRGIGYHRLGVPGYMLPGTEQWSTAQGKVCPGNRRIAQIPQVIARAQQILNGNSGGFLMALTDAQQAQLAADAQFIADQMAGPDWRKGTAGWPTQRWGGDQESLTVVDLLRRIDRQLNSVLDLSNRPMPAGTGDNEFGHLLSLRAEVQELLAAAGKAAPVSGGTAVAGSLSDDDVARIAKAVADENARRQES